MGCAASRGRLASPPQYADFVIGQIRVALSGTTCLVLRQLPRVHLPQEERKHVVAFTLVRIRRHVHGTCGALMTHACIIHMFHPYHNLWLRLKYLSCVS